MTRILTGKARGVQGWFQKWYLVDPGPPETGTHRHPGFNRAVSTAGASGRQG